MDFITKFIIPNIAYILVFVSICYIGTFIYMIVTKKSFTYKLKNLVAFVIILGIGAAIFLYHGIIFWTIGFGICHIVYGLIMYKKYDLK